MIALVTLNPAAVAAVYQGLQPRIDVPGLGAVFGANVGWQQGNYRLVAVTAFVVPNGQVVTGNPQYVFDGNVVAETYTTIAAPPVVLSWSPTIITKALQSIQKAKADLFFNKMADSDRAKFIEADSIAETDQLLLDSLAAPGVGITLAQLKAAILALP